MEAGAYVEVPMRMTRNEALGRIAALPEWSTGEFVGGDLVVSPRSAAAHGHAAFELGVALGAPFRRGQGGPGGWWFQQEPELHLGEDILVPDLAGWRVQRMPVVPDTAAFTLAPDWICEVLSPSTARLDRAEKLPAYAAAGVEWTWLVDPRARTLEIFRLVGGRWSIERVVAGDAAVEAPPFEAVPLELGALWLPEAAAPPG